MPATTHCLSRGGTPILALVWILAAALVVTYGAMQYIAPRGTSTLPRTSHVKMRQQMQDSKGMMTDKSLREGLSGYKSSGGGGMGEDPEAWTGGLFFAVVLFCVMASGLFGNGLNYSKVTEPLGNFLNFGVRVLGSTGVKVGKTFTESGAGQILPVLSFAGVVYVSSGRQVTLPNSDMFMGLGNETSGGGDPTSLGKAWQQRGPANKPGEEGELLVPVTTVDRRYTTETQPCEPWTLPNDTDPTGGAIGVDMECDSKDASGSWWRVRLTQKNKNGSFRAEVVEGNGAIWSEVWPGNCRPAVANYPSFEIQQRDLPVFKPDDWDITYFPPQEYDIPEDYPGKPYTDAVLLNEELPDPMGRNEKAALANIDKNYDMKWKGNQLCYFWPNRDLPVKTVNELQKKKR